MQNVSEVCDALIKSHKTDRLTLNVTGGTKISALAAFQEFLAHGKEISYVNTASNQILHLTVTTDTKRTLFLLFSEPT